MRHGHKWCTLWLMVLTVMVVGGQVENEELHKKVGGLELHLEVAKAAWEDVQALKAKVREGQGKQSGEVRTSRG